MTRIFFATPDGDWEALELEASRYWLLPGGPPKRAVGLGRGRARPGAALHPWRTPAAPDGADRQPKTPDGADRRAWALLARPGARVFRNGEPVALGLAVLCHRDELRVADGGPLYFSDERRLRVEPYAGDDAPRCPRCAQAISAGEASVLCPGCGVRHHELEARRCWTYAPDCALCAQPTALDAGLRWTPEGL